MPTADGREFTDAEQALAYVSSRQQPPVIKAAGLAAGKGVIVPETTAEACDAIRRIMVDKAFGKAGKCVVVEERLAGREVSVIAVTDGRTLHVLPPCQDHKRLLDGDVRSCFHTAFADPATPDSAEPRHSAEYRVEVWWLA